MTLVYGIDVSGNLESGNYKYMGIFICTKEFHDATVKKLGLDKTQISLHKRQVRNTVLSQIRFKNRECLALCVKMERKAALEWMSKATRSKTKHMNVNKIMRTYNRELWRSIEKEVMGFLHRHRQGYEDIIFESDQDCILFLVDMGIKHTDPGHGYTIADAIAWANNRGNEPSGVKRINAYEKILKRMT